MKRSNVAFLGTLAVGAATGIISFAGKHVVWAQAGPGSGPVCQPGVRAGSGATGGSPGNGDRGTLQHFTFEMRFCGERGREMYTMGGAPYVYEVEWTLDHFSPNTLPNPNVWVPRFGPLGPLCSTVPSASDLPGAKLTGRLVTYGSKADVSTTVTLSPDTEKPTLDTTSRPAKGTKVKPGDTIKIRLEASEEYSDDRKGWQTGVKKLQLIDESPKPVVTPHWEGTQMRACAAKQWKQFLEVTYTVPPNPPPVIRLRAVAEDFAGNRDEDVAEFPTMDFTGTYEWVRDTVEEGGPTGLIKNYSRHSATIALVPQFDGTLKGSVETSFVMISSQRMPTGCLASDVRGDVMTWETRFTGEARRQPDGSLTITMPITNMELTYPFTMRNECDAFTGEDTVLVPRWPWPEVTLKNGVFNFESSPPLGPGEFGAPGRGSGLRMHLEQRPPPTPR